MHLLYAYSLDTVVRFKNFEYNLYIQIRVTLLNKVDQFDGINPNGLLKHITIKNVNTCLLHSNLSAPIISGELWQFFFEKVRFKSDFAVKISIT